MFWGGRAGLRRGHTSWPPCLPGFPQGDDSRLGHLGRLSFISRPHFLRLHNGLSGRLGSSPKRPSSLPTQEIDVLSWRFLKLPSQEEKSQDPKGCVREGQGTRDMGTLMTLSLGCPS